MLVRRLPGWWSGLRLWEGSHEEWKGVYRRLGWTEFEVGLLEGWRFIEHLDLYLACSQHYSYVEH